jgi:alkylation response protein AidB-like acyl-CoA dehydrogenase
MRRHLEEADFARLQQAGYLLASVPVAQGGYWRSTAQSVRLLCDCLRTLAHGDSSVALVAAMHPAVLSYWLCLMPEAAHDPGLAAQLTEILDSVRRGCWWGTITSEPGSGGDVALTRATARPAAAPHEYRLSGEKHFGSGSGMLHTMVTTALPEGELAPDWFFLQLGDVPWDGSAGVRLLAEWDGHGMLATQSHSFRFENVAATRIAHAGQLPEIARRTGSFISCLFTAVIVGIVEVALETARAKLSGRKLAAYEAVTWQQAQADGWLLQQAFEGMVRAVETLDDPRRDCLQGKTACAELAEKCLSQIARVLGGGAFHRSSPLGYWQADVRALGYLRPPWGLAYATLIAGDPGTEPSQE